MGDKQLSDSVPITWSVIWRPTLALPSLLWCVGFLISLSAGCGTRQAILKAIAYTLSGLVGWTVYLVVSRSTRRSSAVIFLGLNISMMLNLPLVNPTEAPWPFPEMLASGLLRSALGAAVAGLVVRRLGRGKSLRASGAHPRTNAESAPDRTALPSWPGHRGIDA